MGEEWAASTRWPFFTSHPEPELAAVTREGRFVEFARHGWNTEDVADPQDPRTYRSAILDWTETDAPPHRHMLRLYRQLIALRGAEPDLRDSRLDRVHVDYDEDARVVVVHRGSLRVAANLAAQPRAVPVRASELVLSTGDAEIGDDGLWLEGESAAIVRVAGDEWPAAELIETARLTLEPLRPEHADEMAPILDDPALHAFIGGQPETLEQLRARYERQAVGRSPDGAQGWLNWIVRLRDTGAAVGTIQATVYRADPAHRAAELAWVIGTAYQGRGLAREAAAAMAGWLRQQGVQILVAHIHPEHEASAHVARSLGLSAADAVVDGEIRWQTIRG
jgi:RimJ/RimL family protein N-acetyltransferase